MKFKIGDLVNVENTYEESSVLKGSYATVAGTAEDMAGNRGYLLEEDGCNMVWLDDDLHFIRHAKKQTLFGYDLVFYGDGDTTVARFFGMNDAIWEHIVRDAVEETFKTSIYNRTAASILDNFPKKYGNTTVHAQDKFSVADGMSYAKNKLRERLNRAKLQAINKVFKEFNYNTNDVIDNFSKLNSKLRKSIATHKEVVLND